MPCVAVAIRLFAFRGVGEGVAVSGGRVSRRLRMLPLSIRGLVGS